MAETAAGARPPSFFPTLRTHFRMVQIRRGEGEAIFDGPSQEYRYRLTRTWDSTRGRVHFICLNPSTADENVLDPTLTRCRNFAQRWGYGGLAVSNLFALRSTDPRGIYEHPAPVGPENDAYILATARTAHLNVAAWGVHGTHLHRAAQVERALREAGVPLYELGRTKDGHPRHPLYLRSDLLAVPRG